MRKIYKYPLNEMGCILTLPKGAEILTVKLLGETPTVWVIVNTHTSEMEDRHICIVGDEMDVDDSMKYITTYIGRLSFGHFVRHVFEKIK